MTKHLIPETPARRLPVTFDYAHSAPIVVAGRVLSGDRSDELEMVRDAADGFIAAVRNSREGALSRCERAPPVHPARRARSAPRLRQGAGRGARHLGGGVDD